MLKSPLKLVTSTLDEAHTSSDILYKTAEKNSVDCQHTEIFNISKSK